MSRWVFTAVAILLARLSITSVRCTVTSDPTSTSISNHNEIPTERYDRIERETIMREVHLGKRDDSDITAAILALRTQRFVGMWSGIHGIPLSRQPGQACNLTSIIFQSEQYTLDNWKVTSALLQNFVDRIIMDVYWNQQVQDWYLCPYLIPGISGLNDTLAESGVKTFVNDTYYFTNGAACSASNLTLTKALTDIQNWMLSDFTVLTVNVIVLNLHDLGIVRNSNLGPNAYNSTTSETSANNSTDNDSRLYSTSYVYSSRQQQSGTSSLLYNSARTFASKFTGWWSKQSTVTVTVNANPFIIGSMFENSIIYTPQKLKSWRQHVAATSGTSNPYFTKDNFLTIGWPTARDLTTNNSHIIAAFGTVDDSFRRNFSSSDDITANSVYNVARDFSFLFNSSNLTAAPILDITALSLAAMPTPTGAMNWVPTNEFVYKRMAQKAVFTPGVLVAQSTVTQVTNTPYGVSSTLVSCVTPAADIIMHGTGFDIYNGDYSANATSKTSWNWPYIIADQTPNEFSSDVLSSIVQCGFSPVFSANFSTDNISPLVWSWESGSPATDEDENCAVFVAETGRWRAESCVVNNAVVCQQLDSFTYTNGTKVEANPFNFTVVTEAYSYLAGLNKCTAGSQFGVPRTAQENAELQRVLRAAGVERAWINLRQIEPTCWVLGTDANCPYSINDVTYQEVISATLQEDLVVVILLGLYAIFLLRGMLHQSRIRRFHANALRKIRKMDYKSVPK